MKATRPLVRRRRERAERDDDSRREPLGGDRCRVGAAAVKMHRENRRDDESDRRAERRSPPAPRASVAARRDLQEPLYECPTRAKPLETPRLFESSVRRLARFFFSPRDVARVFLLLLLSRLVRAYVFVA